MVDLDQSQLSYTTEINSDDDIPQELKGDISVISLNGILKEIITCGEGFEKPGIGDEIIISWYWESNIEQNNYSTLTGEPLYMILGNSNLKECLSTSHHNIPWGIELAIRVMSKGEISRVYISSNSAYKYPREQGKSLLDISIISGTLKHFNSRSKRLVEYYMGDKRNFVTAIVQIMDFCHISIINVNTCKKIWINGKGWKLPGRKDILHISVLPFEELKSSNYCGYKVGIEQLEIGSWDNIVIDLNKYFGMNIRNITIEDIINIEENKEISKILGYFEGININDLIEALISMKIEEISELRFFKNKNKTIHLIIKLRYFTKNIDISFNPPILNYKFDEKIQLIYTEICRENFYTNNTKDNSYTKSLKIDHTTRIILSMSELRLINNHLPKNNLSESISLPISCVNIVDERLIDADIKSAEFIMTPGLFTTPLWLEALISEMPLNQIVNVRIPISYILFIPPKNIIIDSNEEILNDIYPFIILNKPNNEPTYIRIFWDFNLLLNSLENLGVTTNEIINSDMDHLFIEMKLMIKCVIKHLKDYVAYKDKTKIFLMDYYKKIGNIFYNYQDPIFISENWYKAAVKSYRTALEIARLLFPLLSNNKSKLSECSIEDNLNNEETTKSPNSSILLKYKETEVNNEIDQEILKSKIIFIATNLMQTYIKLRQYRYCLEIYDNFIKPLNSYNLKGIYRAANAAILADDYNYAEVILNNTQQFWKITEDCFDFEERNSINKLWLKVEKYKNEIKESQKSLFGGILLRN
ncbi:hypothetical protein cand_033750 [Cryptosporidium andersoni]|uniref:Uncharacterized protein n=1 Tax=Cryptosporidium andersoni TaxID=117008 RepID=A0A1J4MZC7_9CRYT|nr:hypothetical protein cand_033750 [Cryptosporidium andersoni]